jgi:anti-sigma factor RsiW
MTTRQISIDEDDFQAFVDGQLPPERRRAVMAYLATRPEESARMDEYRKLSEALHTCFDDVLHEPLPKRLTVAHYRDQRSWSGRLRRWFGLGDMGLVPRIATIAVAVVASGVGGWYLNDVHTRPALETPAMSFARLAANAHVLFASDLRHPVEFGADQQDSLLLWLSERLGQAVNAPNLQELGFTLVGGRLLPSADQPAAQLMYDSLDGHRITLYIRGRWTTPLGSTAHDGTVSFAGEGGVSMVYWINGPLAYALIGELDREQLFGAAKTIQQQVQPSTLPTPEQTATTEKGAT